MNRLTDDRICPLVFLPAIAIFLAVATTSVAANERPNFIVLLVDDLGYHDLGCYGSSFYETPNLDRFSSSALRFTNGYAAHPVCSPTRAAIMSGKNPARVRITDWIPGQNPKNRKLITPNDRHELPLEEVTIAERMRDAGYRTFYAGKWHLGSNGHFPEDQGFEINRGGHHRGSPPGGYYSPYKNPKLEDGPKGEYLTDRLTDETIRFIETKSDKPFFAYLSFYTVHTPIQAAKPYIAHFEAKAKKLPPLAAKDPRAQKREHDGWTKQRQDNAAYASMIRALDENVGRLLRRLDKLDAAKNTVVVFTSDNGGRATLHRPGHPTSNLPLRAGKGWCYEGGIRVPFLVRAPGLTKAGSTSDVPIQSADLYPTILSLAGLPLDPKQHADGVDLAPVLRGKASLDRPFIVWHYPHYHGSAWTPGSAIRAGKWKLIEFWDKEKVELYDLEKDVGERNDLSKTEPERTARLRATLREFLASVDAQMPKRNPDPKAGTKKPKRERKGKRNRR